MAWVVFIGMPMLLVWVIGMPLLALVIIIRNRKNLEDWKIKKYFLVLYQGLRKETFYWEFVNTFRKFIILLFNVFLTQYDSYYRILLATSRCFYITYSRIDFAFEMADLA